MLELKHHGLILHLKLETPNINCQTDFISQNSILGALQGKKQHFVVS